MFNPAKASKKIKEEFIDYIATTYKFSDSELEKKFREALNNEISKGPYLQLNNNFKSGKSINELIKEGILSPLFTDIEKAKPENPLYKRILPLDRALYAHQVESIKKISRGENVVISTGTGSGKTNCFLIPVINELLREKELGTLDDGVRAIFIYPMNALANDQVKNIRTLLMKYPDITFGVYNSSTKHNNDEAINSFEGLHDEDPVPELRKPLKNERISRKALKENPPHILFTNYSMLEHLMLRPKDDVLFRNNRFKFVVLDEAHIYTGATGIETSFLIRRLKARLSTKTSPQFILTSATLGNGDRNNDITKFARNLCGEEFKEDCIIESQRERITLPTQQEDISLNVIRELADETKYVTDVLRNNNIPFNDKSNKEEEILYDLLYKTKYFSILVNFIGKVTSINDLSNKMVLSEDDVIDFVSLCTRAEKNGKSLIDAKYHFFLRALDGCFVSLSSKRTIELTRKQKDSDCDNSYLIVEIAVCNNCGKIAFIGNIESGYLKLAKSLEAADYFAPINDNLSDYEIIEDDEDQEIKLNDSDIYYLCPHCGRIVSSDEDLEDICECGSNEFIKVVRAKTGKKGVNCADCNIGRYKRFYLGYDAATSVIATALYEELPEKVVYKYSSIEPDNIEDNPFLMVEESDKHKELISSGQQFLVFSDSRQEAAKFACYLSDAYEEFLRRRGIYHVIRNEGTAEFEIVEFANELTRFFSNKRVFSKKNDYNNSDFESKRQAWVAILNEMSRFNSPTSLTALGFIQFHCKEINQKLVEIVYKKYNPNRVNMDSVYSLLELLAFEFIKAGAIEPVGVNLLDGDREYIFYSPKQRKISLEKTEGVSSHWLPKKIQTKQGFKIIRTLKVFYVKSVLGLDDDSTFSFLKNFFEIFSCKYKSSSGVSLPADLFKIRTTKSKDAKWYKCKKCGHVSQFHLNYHCIISKCCGEVMEISPDILNENNHYANLYKSNQLTKLFIKEHTAQLGKENSLRYQEEFIKKEINALSCSTTFEMGVDVGDLETVFLRNMPPLPSNYAQRAGRAGRSKDASAYALTFAKQGSHDFTYFNSPEKMIIGTINPPLFKTANEKVFRRHIYAVALSMFFADHEEMYNGNKANKFLDDKGYVLFKEWLNSHPDKLKNQLKKSFYDNELYDDIGIENFKWIEGLFGNDGVLSTLINYYESTLSELHKLEKKSAKNGLELVQIQNKIKKFQNNELVDFLARGNILPRYGFPIDTVELYQNLKSAKEDSDLCLNRDLLIALAEYAPSSEVIANGKLYTSRYIRLDKSTTNTSGFNEIFLAECECGTMNQVQFPNSEGHECIVCGKIIDKGCFRPSIEPRSGFIAEEKVQDVPMKIQEKNYRSEVYYLYNNEAHSIEQYTFKCGNILVGVESTTNDSLMVKSESNFFVCGKCGFAKEENENLDNPKGKEKNNKKMRSITYSHSTPLNVECTNNKLSKKSLHHIFHTDVAKISFSCNTKDYDTMLSVMYAILYSVSDVLNIERRDINACITFKKGNSRDYQIIIYDAVPGGAGHSRRIVSDDGKILSEIFKAAYKRVAKCDCDPSCYKCLRSYENQKKHENLNRNLAKEFLEQLQYECIAFDNEDEATFY